MTLLDKIALGKLVRFLREQEHMQQKDLARLLHVSPGTVSKWETGINYPDTPILGNLATLFHISVDDLFHPQETMERLEKAQKLLLK
ncbi:MAG: helix-turn-helix domain-containing protein [Roseburia sp.]|nr:helix-turn-helix domain-containing protein [Roseburia sp.]